MMEDGRGRPGGGGAGEARGAVGEGAGSCRPRPVRANRPRECPARSCKEILAANPRSATGVYKIDPAGGTNGIDVYCEMTKEGGGWTLLVRHKASSGYFGNATKGQNMNPTDPNNGLYSILGKVDSFKDSNGTYEFLYWNVTPDKYIVSKQTWSPLDTTLVGKCPTGYTRGNVNYAVALHCGYTWGPLTYSTINGYGPNWTHAVGQFVAVAGYPLACTYNDSYKCDYIEFYVR
jgi:hypothetical protein